MARDDASKAEQMETKPSWYSHVMPDQKPKQRTPTDAEREFLDYYIPDRRRQDELVRFQHHMQIDAPANAALKGHLLIEEKLNVIIEKFVHHPEQVESARLGFAQKVAVARSMSLDEHGNTVWDVVNKMNALRNALAHHLDNPKRDKALEGLKTEYTKQVGSLEAWEEESEENLISGAVMLCLGFLGRFEQEVERFKEWVHIMDKSVNPHRHKKP
jgi:hypothetical protein